MSSDESDEDDNQSTYRGTRMGRTRTNARQPVRGFNGIGPGADNMRMNDIYTRPTNQPLSSQPRDRTDLGMHGENDQPTCWDAVNYPRESEFDFESYYLRYIRQAEAKAIIDKPVNDTWQDMPTVKDAAYADQDGAQSEFEKKVNELFSGEHTRRKPIHRLNVLDRLARLGHYSILVIGFADGRGMDTPVGGVDATATMSDEAIAEAKRTHGMSMPDDLTQPEFDDLDDMMYLAVFGEDRVQDMRTNSDMTSERFRLPEEFDVITEEKEDNEKDAEYDNETIHWTRVIHTPEGTLEDDLRGIPALKPIFHDLLNIDKIKAASGEGYWRAGYSGMHIRQPQDSQGRFVEFDDPDDVKNEIQQYINNLDRMLTTPAEIDTLDSSISNPMPHLDANYQSISAATDIPKSILTGEDRADTASADDFSQYKSFIAQRRNNYAGPAIVEPLIQRLIDSGVLPEPEGDGFNLEWEPLDELSLLQEADRRQTIAKTIATLAPAGDTSLIAEVGELRQVLGWGSNMGSEINEQQRERQREQQPAEEFPYPDELFQTVEQAQSRSRKLGLGGEFQVRRVDGEVRYAPGGDLRTLEEALSTAESNRPSGGGSGGSEPEPAQSGADTAENVLPVRPDLAGET